MNVCNRFLPAANGFDRGERLREPVAQQSRAHRRDGAVDRAVQRGVARGIVLERLQNFEVPQGCVIECEKIGAAIAREPGELLHVPAQMLREIMQRRARRADGRRAVLQPKTVERRDLEMFAHGKLRRFRGKGPVIVAVQNLEGVPQQIPQRGRLAGINDFRRTQPFEFGEQRRMAFDLRRQKIAGGQIHERQAEYFPRRTNRRKEVVPLGHEHSFIEMGAGREDLGDLAFDELAGPGVFELIANGDLATGPEQPANVSIRRVMRQAAHGKTVARGERQIENLRAGLRVLEKHLVEIAQAEEQQRVLGQFALDPAILRHHGCELDFVGHR